jgi:prepilin-type N-terminal cleavage/methylation domain-containing protein
LKVDVLIHIAKGPVKGRDRVDKKAPAEAELGITKQNDLYKAHRGKQNICGIVKSNRLKDCKERSHVEFYIDDYTYKKPSKLSMLSTVIHLKSARQQGFTLIELAVSVVLSAMLTSGLLLAVSDFLQGQTAQAKGQALFALNQAVNSYESKYSTQLANDQPIAIPGYANVANIYAPTPAELFELSLLPNSTPAGTYGVKIGATLIGGVPSGMVWITTPFENRSGEVDLSLAGEAMEAAGGDAGMSTLSSPTVIEGIDGWTTTNPQASTAGIVAMRNGSGSGAYLRLDGSTPMQGALNLNSHDITNVSTLGAGTVNGTTVNASAVNSTAVTATSVTSSNVSASNISASTVTSGTLTATATGNDVFFGASTLYSDGWNTAIRQGGTLYVQNTAGASNSLDAKRVTAEEYLQVEGAATAGGGCSPNGLIGQNGQGAPLFCVNGLWVAAGGGGSTVAVSSGSWQSSAIVTCPTGYNVTGGSCDMYRDGDGREISPRTCEPYGNGYYCNEGNGGNCIAHAICQQQ